MDSKGSFPLLEYSVSCLLQQNIGASPLIIPRNLKKRHSKRSGQNCLALYCTWCMEMKRARAGHPISKGSSASRRGNLLHGLKTLSPSDAIWSPPKGPRSKLRTIAKRTVLSKSTVAFQEDAEPELTSARASNKSKREKTFETSRNSIRRLFFDMEAECSDCDSTSDQSEQDHPRFGPSGARLDLEKRVAYGSSPIHPSSGYIPDKAGSTDTTDTRRSSSTISTADGSKSVTFSSCSTDMSCPSQ